MNHLKSFINSTVLILIFLPLWAQDLDQSKTDLLLVEAKEDLLHSRFDASINKLTEAKKLFELTSTHTGIIKCENLLAENKSALFLIDEALTHASKALSLSLTHLDSTDQLLASSYNNLGNVYFLNGQHKKALVMFEQALSIHHEHDSIGNLFVAPSNTGLGNVYYNKFQFAKAFDFFNTALATNIQLLGTEHPYVANAYLSLGNLYKSKGKYNLALENYEKGLSISSNNFGEEHPDIADAYIGIGEVHASNGDFESALQYYNQAEVILKMFFKTPNPKFGNLQLGYADVYKNQGQYEDAVRAYMEAKEIFSSTIGKFNQQYIRANLGIGNTFLYQEKFTEALDYYNRVLEVNYYLEGEEHVNTTAAYNNLGSINYFFGNFKLAIKLFNKSLTIARNIHGKDHPDVANAYYNLARVYGELGQTEQSLSYIQDAINASILDFEDENIFINPALLNYFDDKDLLWYLSFKGEMLKEGFKGKGNVKGLDIALKSLILSDTLLGQITQSYTDRQDKIEIQQFARAIYDNAIDVSYALINELEASNVKTIAPEATYEEKLKEYKNWFLRFTEKNKAAILFSALASSNAISFGGIPDSLVNNEKMLKEEINRLTQELSVNTDSLYQIKAQKELFVANRKYNQLIELFETEFPKYHDLKYNSYNLSTDELQSFIDDSTLVVSYHTMEDSMFVQYLGKELDTIYKVEKHPEFDKYIKGIRNAVIYDEKRLMTKIARALFVQLFPGDIPSHIKHLELIMDGAMATVPFDILLTDETDVQLPYSEMPFLIKQYSIAHTFAANLLYNTFQNKKTLKPKANNELLALAPVSFGTYLTVDKDFRIPSGLNRLDGTRREVQQLDSLFDSNATKILLDHRASEAALKSDNSDQYQYIHIASHGFVNQEKPAYSGVFLSANDTIQDGILFSGEIYNLTLNAELVTLSACETGLGKVSRGEGIVGLSQALIFAGTKNILVSLWKVSDLATTDLMTAFYAGFAAMEVPKEVTKSLNYAPALRAAKLKLLNDERYNHPQYWSSFVLIGK